MSKKFLVLGAVVTTLVLLFAACAQPTELDGASISVNNFGVEPPRNVQAVAYTGAVRLTWEAPQTPPTGYYVTRQVKDSADPAVVVSGNITNAIYYVDSALTGPTKLESGTYIYKVVAYNTAGQGVGRVTAESEIAEVSVTVPAKGIILPMPEAEKDFKFGTAADPVADDTVIGNTQFDYYFKLTDINPLYTYSSYQLWYNDGNLIGGWTFDSNINPGNVNLTLDSAGFEPVVYLTAISVNRTPAARKFKIVATVGVNTNQGYSNGHNWKIGDTTITQTAATDPALSSTNQIVIGTF
jgi:hypothetical protein